jgi:hypothetical protein
MMMRVAGAIPVYENKSSPLAGKAPPSRAASALSVTTPVLYGNWLVNGQCWLGLRTPERSPMRRALLLSYFNPRVSGPQSPDVGSSPGFVSQLSEELPADWRCPHTPLGSMGSAPDQQQPYSTIHHSNPAAAVVFVIRLLVTKPDIQQFHHFSAIARYSAGYQKRKEGNRRWKRGFDKKMTGLFVMGFGES